MSGKQQDLTEFHESESLEFLQQRSYYAVVWIRMYPQISHAEWLVPKRRWELRRVFYSEEVVGPCKVCLTGCIKL